MKNLLFILLSILLIISCTEKKTTQNVITEDIDNFWEAYDSIQTTTDSSLQLSYLKTLFLDKGTEGLTATVSPKPGV